MTTAFQSNAFQNSGFQVDPVTGVIYAIDQNDSCSMAGTVSGGPSPEPTIDTHDGFTPEEVKRIKKLQKKLAIAEAQKVQARLDKRMQRRKSLQDAISPQPVAKLNETKLELTKDVKIERKAVDLVKLNAEIAKLERQKQEIMRAAQLRMELARVQSELAIHEAKLRTEELDDEETLLMLL